MQVQLNITGIAQILMKKDFLHSYCTDDYKQGLKCSKHCSPLEEIFLRFITRLQQIIMFFDMLLLGI